MTTNATTKARRARKAPPASGCTFVNPWSAGCPSREILGLLADKWVMLIVPLLLAGPRRNNDLLRGVGGVSQKMLTQTLRELERHGLVERRDHREVPPRVEYALTPLGRSLADTVGALDRWVVDNFHRVDAARRSYRRPSSPSPMRGA